MLLIVYLQSRFVLIRDLFDEYRIAMIDFLTISKSPVIPGINIKNMTVFEGYLWGFRGTGEYCTVEF